MDERIRSVRPAGCGTAWRSVWVAGLLAVLAGGPVLAVTQITIFDDMANAAGQPLYGRETRWEDHDLNYHGEAVAQSAIYGYDFMCRAGGIDALARGNNAVQIVRWSDRAPSDDLWIANAETCYNTMYNEGCRIFNQSFGSSAVDTPEWDGWLVEFAREKAALGDPIVVTIGSGNDPRDTSNFDILPLVFGGAHFYPNYLATSGGPYIQVTGLEDDLSQVRWTGYESTFSDRWRVDLAASVKLWDFDAQGRPYWWGNRVGTSFSCAVVAGAMGYLQAYLRDQGLNPTVNEIRQVLLGEAAQAPFAANGRVYQFPFVESHTHDQYTDWSQIQPYALDPSLGVYIQFDDVTRRFVYKGSATPVTKEIVRRGVVSAANATAILQAFNRHYGLPALPAGWDSTDIGNGLPGSLVVQPDNTWAIGGGGADIWGQADAFRYTYTPVVGDFSLTCRVKSQTDTDPWAKVGVMIRDGVAAGSRQLMEVRTPGNGVDAQWRASTNSGSSDYKANAYPGTLPLWLRLQRQGSRFTAFASQDGSSWTQVGPARQITMNNQVYAGIAVTAHNSGRVSAAQVDQVSVR